MLTSYKIITLVKRGNVNDFMGPSSRQSPILPPHSLPDQSTPMYCNIIMYNTYHIYIYVGT